MTLAAQAAQCNWSITLATPHLAVIIHRARKIDTRKMRVMEDRHCFWQGGIAMVTWIHRQNERIEPSLISTEWISVPQFVADVKSDRNPKRG